MLWSSTSLATNGQSCNCLCPQFIINFLYLWPWPWHSLLVWALRRWGCRRRKALTRPPHFLHLPTMLSKLCLLHRIFLFLMAMALVLLLSMTIDVSMVPHRRYGTRRKNKLSHFTHSISTASGNYAYRLVVSRKWPSRIYNLRRTAGESNDYSSSFHALIVP